MGNKLSAIKRVPSHNKVWINYYKNESYTFCQCPVCHNNYMDKEIHTIEKNYGGWRRGYKISKRNGGSNHLTNLIPICWDCNNNIGDKNIRDL